MNVLFYIPKLSREFGGIYQYTLGLLSSLRKSEHQYFLYCWEPDSELKTLVESAGNLHFVDTKYLHRSTLNKERFNIETRINSVLNKLLKIKPFDGDYLFDIIVKKYNIAITHCPYSVLFKYKNLPNISTIHDVQELHFPSFFTSSQRASRAVGNMAIIDKSDAIVVSYNHIKNDIVELFQKPEEQVHVCLIDMKNLWFEKFLNNPPKQTQIDLPAQFVFYPAVMWQHKNHINLIKSIAWLRDHKNIELNIVFTGDNKVPFGKTVIDEITKCKLQNNVHFMGVVSDEQLFFIYQKALATVVPTLYEAGSFPLMESILMEKNVICSNVTSLPETIGDEQFVFDPNNIEEMAQKIERICFDPTYREENSRRIKLQQNRLKNTGIVEKVEAIYSSLNRI